MTGTIQRVATLEFVLARGGRLERSRTNPCHFVAIDEIGARFDVWVNAVAALERRGSLEISETTAHVVVYRLKTSSSKPEVLSHIPRGRTGGRNARFPAVDQS